MRWTKKEVRQLKRYARQWDPAIDDSFFESYGEEFPERTPRALWHKLRKMGGPDDVLSSLRSSFVPYSSMVKKATIKTVKPMPKQAPPKLSFEEELRALFLELAAKLYRSELERVKAILEAK